MLKLAFAQVSIFLHLLLLFIIEEANAVPSGATTSLWLKKVTTNQRPVGCARRPWICRQERLLGSRMLCCRNRCVDVSSDVNHCGLCRFRCRFTRQCCRGFCVDTNFSRFNCGTCGNRCGLWNRCYYGLCGYANPFPPRPPNLNAKSEPELEPSHKPQPLQPPKGYGTPDPAMV